jgi:hypothetical protein
MFVYLAYGGSGLHDLCRLKATVDSVVLHPCSVAPSDFHSSRLTRELFVAEKRPWIKVDVSVPKFIVEPMYRDDGRITIQLSLVLSNIGDSPALRVTRGWLQLYIDGTGISLHEFFDKIRGEIDPRMDYMGRIIFPKDSLPIECTLDILPMQIEQSKTAKGAKFLPICLKYYSELTGIVHETSSVFIFGITDPILALDPDTQRFLSKKVCFERMAGFDRIT